MRYPIGEQVGAGEGFEVGVGEQHGSTAGVLSSLHVYV
jgi:hypothetical protein